MIRLYRRTTHEGSALIVAVAVLSVLALLAVSFARLMVVEQQATRSHMDQVHARFAAESGIEDATARLSTLLVRQPELAWTDDFVFPGARGTTLAEAAQVSFQGGTTGSGYPYSGQSLPEPAGEEGRYETDGVHYALKVLDLASMIHVRRFEGMDQGAARLMNNLGERLNADGVFTVLDSTMGNALAQRVPADGFVAIDDVKEALIDNYGGLPNPALERDLERLEDFVTVYGWTDPSTVRPAGGGALSAMASPDDSRAAHPININTAPAEILYALFKGVSARWTDGDGNLVQHEVGQTQAENLANHIVDVRENSGRVFRTQADIENALVEATLITGYGIDRKDAMVLMAMLNPNGRIARFNPDPRLRYLSSAAGATFGFTAKGDRNDTHRVYCDKSSLSQWTTEAAFDSNGRFKIVSLGRLVAPNGSVLASHQVEVIVRLADRFTWTTQQEIESLLDQAQNVTSYPESLPNNGAAHGPSDVTGGLRLDGSDGLPNHTTLAGPRPGDGKALLPAGHDVSAAPWNSAQSGPVMSGAGDRVSDGFLSDPAKDRVLAYGGDKLPIDKGTVDFWVKFTEEGLRTSGGLFWGTNDLGAGATANEHKGINTVAHYEFNPATGKGEIIVSRTFFFFKKGVPSTGTVSGYKRKITGELKDNAHEILVQKGREVFDNSPQVDQWGSTYFGEDELAQYREKFAQWYAERMLQALLGGTINQTEIQITHNVVDKFGGATAPT